MADYRKNLLIISGIPEGTSRKAIYEHFGNFAIEKLYVYPQNESCAKIYFYETIAVQQAIKELNGAPPLYLKLQSADVNNSMDDLVSNTSSMDMYENDVITDVGAVYVNVFGDEVPTLSADDGQLYVPLDSVRQIGFELFEPCNEPLHLDYNEQIEKEFELYLTIKARKFVMRNKIHIPDRRSELIKQKLIRQTFPSSPRTATMDSNSIKITTPNNNNQQQTHKSQNKPLNVQSYTGTTNNEVNIQALRQPHKQKDGFKNANMSGFDGAQNFKSNPNVTRNESENSNYHDSKKNNSSCESLLNNVINYQNKENVHMNLSNKNNHTYAKTTKSSSSPVPMKTTFGPNHPVPYKRISLEFNVPIMVVISNVESKNKCWVYKKNDQPLVEKLLYDTNLEALKSTAMQPVVGVVCAATYGRAWYRATIINSNPVLKVHYLDFGNKNTEPLKEVRVLPDYISNQPALAVCIMFENEPSLVLAEDLEMMIVVTKELADGTYLVREENAEIASDIRNVKTEGEVSEPKHTASCILKSEIEKGENAKIQASNVQEPYKKVVAKSTISNTLKSEINEKDVSKTQTVSVQKTHKNIPTTPLKNAEIPEIERNKHCSTPQSSKVKSSRLQKLLEIRAKKSQNPPRKSAVDHVGCSGIFECVDMLDDCTIVATILPESFLDEISFLENINEESESKVHYVAKIGDTVAALREDKTWARGTIINIKNDEYITALIDYGTIITTNSIHHLDQKYQDIPEFTCVCSLDSESMKLVKTYTSDIMFTTVETNKLKLEFTSGVSVIVDCKRWDPFLTSSLASLEVPAPVFTTPPTSKVLEHGEIVLIVNIGNEGKLYVRTRDCNTLFREISQEISQYKAQPLNAQPIINQLVLSSNNESNELYRAVVKSVDRNYAEVEFIDLGYQETVPLKNLKTINEHLACKMSSLILITLKNFESKDFTENALELLNDYCKQKTKFTVVGSADEGVFELQDNNLINVSKKLIYLDQPKYVAIIDSFQEMPEYDLKIGNNDLVCFCVERLNEGTVAFMTSESSITNKFLELAEKIAEYIEIDNEAYIPVNNEICLAQFEDDWYRAKICKADVSKDEFEVYYVDYGNSGNVTSKNIRKIPEEFTKVPPFVVQCVLEDILEKVKNVQVLQRLQKLLVAGDSYNVNVKRKNKKIYHVTIPNVTKILQAEGLLQ